MLIYLILSIVLIISLITDIRSRRILNIVTIPSIIFGIIYFSITQGWNGTLFSILGLFVGIGVLIIPYFLGGMGAGDVKLMGAIGALMGTSFVFYSFVFTALIGGVISVLLIIKNRGLRVSFKLIIYNLVFFQKSIVSMVSNNNKENSITFPYGVPIVLGTFCSLLWGGF